MADKQIVVDFQTQMTAEREFYLGKTETIPGSNLTLKEAREAHEKVVAEFDKQRTDHANSVREAVSKEQAAFRDELGITDSYTSVVVPGVNAQIQNEIPVPSEIAFSQVVGTFEIPTDAEFVKMGVAELITLAGNRRIEVKANVDNKAALIARIKGEYTEARFEPVHGKTRAELEIFATELGFDGADKVAYPNVAELAAEIEKARKK